MTLSLSEYIIKKITDSGLVVSPFIAFIIWGPKASPGKTFIISAPSSMHLITPSIDITPGMQGIWYLLQSFKVSSLRLGLTIYWAPDNIAILAVSGSNMVLAPIIISSLIVLLS